MYNTRISR